MSEPKTVIIYRSRTEESLDRLLYDNPEIVLSIIGVLVLVGVVYAGAQFVVNHRRWWRK